MHLAVDQVYIGNYYCAVQILLSPPHAFFQADKTVIADDEVIDQFDVENTACRDELLGD